MSRCTGQKAHFPRTRSSHAQATAYDLGQQYVEHTGKAVDYGFLLTVEKAKQAVEYTGVAEYASKAIEATNNVIISSVRQRSVCPTSHSEAEEAVC